MIVYDLECRTGQHRFEGWFGSSDDFERQQGRGLVTCPSCGSSDVIKAVQAPNLGRKGNQLPDLRPARAARPTPAPVTNSGPVIPPEAVEMLKAIAKAQAEALKSSTWVGDDFADTARAIHYGERDPEPIHGQASPDEALELIEEGVEIAPVLFPIVPPGEAN
ncbi:DUF1178 family protein [Novosphingobium sp. TH158]|uniref:DUF1178 family protein n=1 Tax=Novosphingobium sp. TH158 TaxID=2067455 RepID=UPI000C7D0775|nr:DUF1178 family protein [Novosphingobium sp. TH158]PLK25836.1 DUF1178 domain-containing protein [Novosphingobium sp. TH158]